MSIATDPEVTQELRVPPAVAEWRAEQGMPPLGETEPHAQERPPRPGCHNLEAWHRMMRLPAGWPFARYVLAELSDDRLDYDEFGVIRPVLASKFRRHAARHSFPMGVTS